ncbi:MAG: putative phage abortive infection protein [Bacteroidales bacterium]|nr:putative phage abortive infection protein [Bacteroidales bacterium]
MKEKDSKWITKAWKWIKENAIMVIVYWIVIFLIIPILFALLNKEEFNSEGLGLFGDFFGGFIGTILTFASVIILAMTFIQQKKVTEANIKQQDIQRFNDMFYELLRLYREQVDSLSEIKKIGEGDKEVVYKGKEFFEWHKKDMQKNIKTQIVKLREKIIDQIIKKGKELKLDGKTIIKKSQQEVIFELEGEELTKDILGQKIDYMLSTNKKIPDVNDKIIDDLCMDFYVKNRDKIAPYFRILYRILDLIDTSPLLEGSEIDKQAYAKILRAQLTESELFFLRYNAQFNMYGEKLKNYLNRYNILKHLPVFELLEFQIFRDDEYKRDRKNEERVNEIFYKICKALRNRGKNHLSFDSERYKIEIRCKEEVTICCAINNNTKVVKGSDDKYFWCLFKVMKKWKNILFEYFMEEIFQASNFYEYNKNAEISVRQIECKCNNTTYIISTIKSDNPIQIGSDLQKEMKTKK